jgi:hypothetical protein
MILSLFPDNKKPIFVKKRLKTVASLHQTFSQQMEIDKQTLKKAGVSLLFISFLLCQISEP